jgi:DNA-binding FrmR family transcriptional regulator
MESLINEVHAVAEPSHAWHEPCSTRHHPMPYGSMAPALIIEMIDSTTKKNVLARLRRIAGPVEGIARMVDEDRYSVDLLLQIGSAQAALGQAGKLVLRSHVETCVTEVMATGKAVERQQKVDEPMQIFSRYGLPRRR